MNRYCPRCPTGTMFSDADGPYCLACGHRPVSEADLALARSMDTPQQRSIPQEGYHKADPVQSAANARRREREYRQRKRAEMREVTRAHGRGKYA